MQQMSEITMKAEKYEEPGKVLQDDWDVKDKDLKAWVEKISNAPSGRPHGGMARTLEGYKVAFGVSIIAFWGQSRDFDYPCSEMCTFQMLCHNNREYTWGEARGASQGYKYLVNQRNENWE
jgi:hypothetical protein